MLNKLIIRIIISGLIAFIIVVPTDELKAKEHTHAISSEPSASKNLDILNPDISKTFPFGDFDHSGNGLSNDQVCKNCIESDSAGANEDKSSGVEH